MDEEIDDIKTKLKCQGKVIDPMTYEMELNRIDFRNDVSSILDQIEKEFEINSVANMGTSLVSTSGHVDLSNLHLDTPPDSDSENNPQQFHVNSDSDNFYLASWIHYYSSGKTVFHKAKKACIIRLTLSRPPSLLLAPLLFSG